MRRGPGRPHGSKSSAGPTKARPRRAEGSDQVIPKRRKKEKKSRPGGDKEMIDLVPYKTGDDEMDNFMQISAVTACVEGPDRQSDMESDTDDENIDGDNELLDPDYEVMKKENKKRGRKRKNPGSVMVGENSYFSMALCPLPLPRNELALISGRRVKKREFTDELDIENTSTICALFKKRKSLKMGRDPDSLITSKLYSIKASPWFEKRVQNSIPLVTRNQLLPLLLLPGASKLMNIMWIYHTNWIVNKTAQQRLLEIDGSERTISTMNSTGIINIDWIQNFLYYFRHFCEEVFRNGRSVSTKLSCEMKAMLDMYISIVVDVSAKEMTKMSLCHFNAFKGVNNWSDTISVAIEQKDNILEKMEMEHHRLLCIDSKLDEGSIWGLKPLRRSLAPPYFKTGDGLAAAPPHPSSVDQANLCPSVFFNFNKQKWTTKDLEALKFTLREVLIEKNLLQIQMTTDVLLNDCAAVKDNVNEKKLMKEVMGESIPEMEVKRRGRPKKFGQSAFLGTIAPHMFTLSSPLGRIIVRYVINNNQIEEWHDKREDKINKLSLVDLLKLDEKIDWLSVSNKTTLKTKKNRSADDCWLAFIHEADPKILVKRWTAVESSQFQDLVKTHTPRKDSDKNIDWEMLNATMGNHRTAFQLFYRWRNKIAPPKKMTWISDKQADLRLNELIKINEGNWKKVAVQCGSELATKKQIIDRYKKNSNAVLRSGAFTRVEDALLLLTIEKLKGHMSHEGHFGELIAYLPWRFETVWRDRAGNLFADWIVPWKIEEDIRLLELAKSMKRNWRKIADSFDSFKTRKGCLTRWKILQRRLQTCKGVEEYHESYAMIRYNIFEYTHLKELLVLLKKVVKEPKPIFKGFRSCRPPTEEDIQDFLLSFDRFIMMSTINSLQKYINERNEFWKNKLQVSTDRKRTFDRRTFHSENPQSVASALHIRGIHLIPKYKLKFKLIEFEEDIYKFYGRFTRTKALKKGTKRPYLPTKVDLSKLKSVKRIIQKTRKPPVVVKKTKKKVIIKSKVEKCAQKKKNVQSIRKKKVRFIIRRSLRLKNENK